MLESTFFSAGGFENQLVVDVVFGVLFPRKLSCGALVAGKSSPHCLHCKAKEEAV